MSRVVLFARWSTALLSAVCPTVRLYSYRGVLNIFKKNVIFKESVFLENDIILEDRISTESCFAMKQKQVWKLDVSADFLRVDVPNISTRVVSFIK